MEGNASIIKLIARDEACVDAFTEVATPTGWKYISELTENDKVAQYDTNIRSISYVIPNKLIKSKTNVLHWYNNKHMEQVVTPDHRMIYLNANLEPKESLSESFSPNHHNYTFVSGYANGKNTHLTPFERLLIMIQADGFVSKRYDGSRVGTIPVHFSFSKERKIKKMIEIFNATGFNWAELKSEKLSKNLNRKIQRNFKINVPVDLLENINPKLFSSWVNLEDKSHVWCNDFISELVNWNGYIPKDKNLNYTYYSSVVEENVSIVQLIASLAGFNAIKGVQYDNRSETYNVVHRLWIHPNRNFRRNGGFVKTIVLVEGEQDMYCVSVPTGAFLMRRNGKVSVTGNCHMNGTQFMINLMKSGKDDPETKEICLECESEVINMFKEACEQEMEWADYLFKDGSMIGLNATILKDYIRYITNVRMGAIGLNPLFPEFMNNPIPWINNWLSSDNVQVAPQETEITSYLVGQVTSDLDEVEFDDFDL